MNTMVVSHFSGMSGLAEKIADFLANRYKKPLFIRTPLVSVQKECLIDTSGGERLTFRIPRLVQYPLEWVILGGKIKKLIRDGRVDDQIDIAIGMDPLAMFTIFRLKRILNIKKIIFFNSDYAEKRFANPLLNAIYHYMDYKAFRDCDTYWCASKKIIDIRKKSFPSLKSKIVYTPHGVSLRKARHYDKRSSNSLVFVGCLSESTEWDFVFEAVGRLVGAFPDICLHIYGDGEMLPELKSNAAARNLESNIRFYGNTSNEEILNTIGKYQIAIAPYRLAKDRDGCWWHFGSGFTSKIVEYLACGLPVITSSLLPGFIELEKNRAGYVIDNSAENLFEKISLLFKTRKLLNDYQKNALNLSKRYDSDKIYGKYISYI